MPRNVARGFPPVSLDKIPGRFNAGRDVELVAFAGADDRLVERRPGLRLGISAANGLAMSIRPSDFPAAAPGADGPSNGLASEAAACCALTVTAKIRPNARTFGKGNNSSLQTSHLSSSNVGWINPRAYRFARRIVEGR